MEVRKYCWKYGSVLPKAGSLQFINNTVSTKYNKVKHNKMRYACIANEALMKCRISFKKLQHAA